MSKNGTPPPATDTVPYRTKLVWENGRPKAVGVPILFDGSSELRIKDLMRETLNLPYEGSDPKYQGLTKGEAIILQMVDQASHGDRKARMELMDRLIGRPMQNVKSVNLKGNLADFLDQLENPNAAPQDHNIIDTYDPEREAADL